MESKFLRASGACWCSGATRWSILWCCWICSLRWWIIHINWYRWEKHVLLFPLNSLQFGFRLARRWKTKVNNKTSIKHRSTIYEWRQQLRDLRAYLRDAHSKRFKNSLGLLSITKLLTIRRAICNANKFVLWILMQFRILHDWIAICDSSGMNSIVMACS